MQIRQLRLTPRFAVPSVFGFLVFALVVPRAAPAHAQQ